MKTSKEYIKNLNNKIITLSMLIDCLYSSNKRAKNYRDKARKYRYKLKCNPYIYNKYNTVEQYENKRDEYYNQKEKLLTILEPKCIHKEFKGYEKRRIKDFEPDYNRYLKKGEYVWSNCYLDKETYQEVYFIDIELKDKPIYFYYLFYDENMKYTFHTPIEKIDIKKYSNLDIIEIDELETEGQDIDDLISNQFVNKVINLIDSKNFKFMRN